MARRIQQQPGPKASMAFWDALRLAFRRVSLQFSDEFIRFRIEISRHVAFHTTSEDSAASPGRLS